MTQIYFSEAFRRPILGLLLIITALVMFAAGTSASASGRTGCASRRCGRTNSANTSLSDTAL